MPKPPISDPNNTEQFERRTAVKKILAGTSIAVGSQAFPDSWIKPSISTAILPAHASTSLELGVCNDLEFSATGNTEGFVENVNLELEAPSSFNGEYSATFASEGNIVVSGNLFGTIEDGNLSSVNYNEKVRISPSAVGQELVVDIILDEGGGFCGRTSTEITTE